MVLPLIAIAIAAAPFFFFFIGNHQHIKKHKKARQKNNARMAFASSHARGSRASISRLLLSSGQRRLCIKKKIATTSPSYAVAASSRFSLIMRHNMGWFWFAYNAHSAHSSLSWVQKQ